MTRQGAQVDKARVTASPRSQPEMTLEIKSGGAAVCLSTSRESPVLLHSDSQKGTGRGEESW